MEEFGSYPDHRGPRRLHAMIVAHQNLNNDVDIEPAVVNAAYNTHLSYHVPACFKCNKKGKHDRLLPSDYKCRMHLPQLPNEQCATVKQTCDQTVFLWNGTEVKQPFHVLKPKRGKYDLFQNTSCPAISLSKISGNSNVVYLFPGPIVIYTTKYNYKGTQKEEKSEFSQVVKVTKKMLNEGRKHEGTRSEIMRMVLRSSFQHNTTNVVGAPMAAFLTRNKNRFYFSHQFVSCPLLDMIETLYRRKVDSRCKRVGKMMIIQKPCLDYICRHGKLEHVCFYNILKNYEIGFVKKSERSEQLTGEDEILPFENTEMYPEKHPSFIRNRMRQGLKLCESEVLVKILQRLFPDAGQFGGSLLGDAIKDTSVTERYCLLVLILFIPFRCLEDLTAENGEKRTFRQRLIEAVQNYEIMDKYKKSFKIFRTHVTTSQEADRKTTLKGIRRCSTQTKWMSKTMMLTRKLQTTKSN